VGRTVDVQKDKKQGSGAEKRRKRVGRVKWCAPDELRDSGGELTRWLDRKMGGANL
jgi:hypothetical protein